MAGDAVEGVSDLFGAGGLLNLRLGTTELSLFGVC